MIAQATRETGRNARSQGVPSTKIPGIPSTVNTLPITTVDIHATQTTSRIRAMTGAVDESIRVQPVRVQPVRVQPVRVQPESLQAQRASVRAQPRSSVALAQLTTLLLLAATLCLTVACGDPTGDNGDMDAAGPISDAGVDAMPDVGPLPCGESPVDGGICLRGRLYDYVTQEPVWPMEAMSIFAFYSRLLYEVLDNPDYRYGRVTWDGRFVIWLNQNIAGEGCLGLVEDVPGLESPVINCYSDNFRSIPESRIDSYRYYVIHEDDWIEWTNVYPGNIDLATTRLLLAMTCLDATWQPLGPDDGEYYLSADFSISQGDYYGFESYAFTTNRRGFIDDALWFWGPVPEGGAALVWYSPHDEDGSWRSEHISMRCQEADEHFYLDRDAYESDPSGYPIVIMNLFEEL